MSNLDIFSAIRVEMEKEDGTLKDKFFLHYVFPRMVGSSNFLINTANELVMSGHTVCFIAIIRPPELNENVSFMNYRSDAIKEMNYDLLIIDSVYHDPEMITPFKRILKIDSGFYPWQQ